ncbi:MAG: SufD family Fe-S cluster assembly protein [Bacillota bacterium]|nr:SufD family Fe-S cluster assembly protein [Bacillota bacterium]
MSLSTEAGRPLDAELFARRVAALGEPEWVAESRREAWRRYEATDLPAANVEAWRKTNLASLGFSLDRVEPLRPEGPRPSDLPATRMPAELEPLLSASREAAVLQEWDGEPVVLPGEGSLPEGVRFLALAQAVREEPELVRSHLFGPAWAEETKLDLLERAAWRGGFFLHVGRGVRVEAPLFLLDWLDRPEEGAVGHSLVVLEPEAEATVVVAVAGRPATGAPGLYLHGVEVYAGEEARLRYIGLQLLGDGTFAFARRSARQAAGSSVEWVLGEFGARVSRSGFRSELLGDGSGSRAALAFLGTGGQHLDFPGEMIHQGRKTTSEMTARGALFDEARSIFRGRTHILRGAKASNAYQREGTLLMDRAARGEAIPSLVIDENEVQAGHAATAGKVDDEQLFYLESRGIPPQEARRLVVAGYFQPLLERVPEGALRETFARSIDRKLG